MLAELDAAPVVPLPAQAAWRGAIKREEKRRKLLHGWHKAVKCAQLWGEED